MGNGDMDIRYQETEEDLAYWEDDLYDKSTSIAELVRGRGDVKTRAVLSL